MVMNELELCQRLLREKYQGIATKDYATDCARLKAGEPYAYVVGFVDFLNVHIDLSYRPMIPRPETAFWVKKAIVELQATARPLRLADTFAGAGNVALALLTHLPTAVVTISEIDPQLAKQINKNLADNKISPARAEVITASGLDGLRGFYDAIFAVPPYVPYEALPELDKEMIEYEPHLAFFAKENGHEFHRLLLDSAFPLLAPGGSLYMEADFDHNATIRHLVKHSKQPWCSLEFWEDPYGATPNVVLRK